MDDTATTSKRTNVTATTMSEKEDEFENKTMSFLLTLGKIIQFNGKQYGMCYFTYDSFLGYGAGYKRDAEGTEDEHANQQSVFKRGFTLPNMTLLRCNLFACLLAVEFAVDAMKRFPDVSCVIVVKHKATVDLVTDERVKRLSNDLTGCWPQSLRQNKSILTRIHRLWRQNQERLMFTFVEPNKNLDGDLEYYTNCDKDPMDESNKCPEGSEEFTQMMRIAKEHKSSMVDLLNVGSFSSFSHRKKPLKKDTLIAKDGTTASAGNATTMVSKEQKKKGRHAKNRKQTQKSDVERLQAAVRANGGDELTARTKPVRKTKSTMPQDEKGPQDIKKDSLLPASGSSSSPLSLSQGQRSTRATTSPKTTITTSSQAVLKEETPPPPSPSTPEIDRSTTTAAKIVMSEPVTNMSAVLESAYAEGGLRLASALFYDSVMQQLL